MEAFEAAGSEALSYFEALWPGGSPHHVGLFLLPSKASLPLPATDLPAAAREAVQASYGGENVYAAACLIDPPGAGRGLAEHARVMAGIWMDCDVAGPAHKSANYPTAPEGWLELAEKMDCPPSMVVDSGWGLYLWWLFIEPRVLTSPEDRQKAHRLVEGAQTAMRSLAASRGWELDPTADLARVLRVPGTTNWKVKEEPRPVRLLDWELRRYNKADLFRAWAFRAPDPKTLPTQDIPDRVSQGHRTKKIESIAGTNRRRNIPIDVALAAALAYNAGHCDPPLSDDKVTDTVEGIYRRYPPAEATEAPKVSSNGAVPPLASEIEPRRIRWIWEPFLPAGKLVLHAGEPGTMKSTFDCALAGTLTRRGQRVIFLNYEDDPADILVPRLMAAGANLLLVRILLDDTTPGKLAQWVRHDRPAVAFIDPFGSWAEGADDIGNERQVRKALQPLKRLAEETGTTVKVNAHVNKQSTVTDALYRISGSLGGMVGYARVVLASARDGDDYLCGIVKGIGGEGLAVRYRPATMHVPTSDGGTVIPKVTLGEREVMSRETFFAPRAGKKPTRAMQCAKKLVEILESSDHGQLFASDVKGILGREGYSTQTIQLAVQIANVKVKGQGVGARYKLRRRDNAESEASAPDSVTGDHEAAKTHWPTHTPHAANDAESAVRDLGDGMEEGEA